MVMRNTFEDGKLAGQKLRELFGDIGNAFALEPVPAKTTEQVLQEVWALSSNSKPHDVVLGFFSEILSHSGYGSMILNVWGADYFLHGQEEEAPICNLPNDSGIFAFADWTGEISDGDTWCYDIEYNCVRCLPVSSASEGDADKARLASYGVSPNFHQLSAYLRREAEMRNLISP